MWAIFISEEHGDLLKYKQTLGCNFSAYKYNYQKQWAKTVKEHWNGRLLGKSTTSKNTTNSHKPLLPSLSSLFPHLPSLLFLPESPFVFCFCSLRKVRYFRSDLQNQQQENFCNSSMTLGSGGSSVVGEFSTLEPCPICVYYLAHSSCCVILQNSFLGLVISVVCFLILNFDLRCSLWLYLSCASIFHITMITGTALKFLNLEL